MEVKTNGEELSRILGGDFNADTSTPIREENSNVQSTLNNIPILTNYEEIEVPYIFTRDLESYENKGWREPNIRISDYFNYGFNEETWDKYSKSILAKFSALKKSIKENRLQLPDKTPQRYIYDFPSDYGGLGEILDEQKYDKLNLFEHKLSKNKTVPWLEVKHGLVYVPLESKNENLNINYNPILTNSQSINPNISHEPSSHQPVFNPLNIPQYYPFYRPPLDMQHIQHVQHGQNPFMGVYHPMMIRPGMPGVPMQIPMGPFFDHSQSTRTKSKDESESESESRSRRKKEKKEKKKKHKRSRSKSRSDRKKHSKSKKSRSRSRSRSRPKKSISRSKKDKDRKKSRI